MVVSSKTSAWRRMRLVKPSRDPRRPPKLPHLWPPKLLHLAGVS